MISKGVASKALSVVLQTGVILLITLLLAEAVLRFYQFVSPSFIFYSDSYNRYRGKPFADDWDFKLNSLGFKDTEFLKKERGVYRIAAIGDSFAFGVVPYRHNYLTLLELALQDGPQRKRNVEVFNFGIPGIGPKDYLALFVNEALVLEPDMLLLSLFTGNDFIESERAWWSYSYLASLIHYVLTIQKEFEGRVIHGAGEYCDDCPNFDPEKYLAIEYWRSTIYLKSHEDFQASLRNAVYYLKLIRDICEELNIPFLVAIIPDELQIDSVLQRQVLDKYYPGIEEEEWDITRPNRLLTAELERMDIDYLDLYPTFKEGSQQRLYRPRDSHWNILGNQLAAKAIAESVRGLMAKY